MNNATEQIFLPSSLDTAAPPGLPKPNGPQPVNLDSVEEFSKVCRVCAAVSELVMPIFSGEGLQNNLADKIHKHLPIKVAETDSPALPVVVCYQCASTLLATHELVQCAAQADAALRTRSAALAAAAARTEENLRKAQECETGDGTEPWGPRPGGPGSSDGEDAWRARDSSDDDRPLAAVAAERPTDVYDAFYAALLNFRNHYLSEHEARPAYPEFTESSDESPTEGRPAADPDEFDDLSGGNMRRDRLDASTRLALARARSRVDGRVGYTCGTCGKRLSSAHTFVFHGRIHTGERPCVCHVCGKQFRAPNGLQRHVAETHERRRRRACRHCARTFANSQNLKQHLRTHTGERPHACALCPKRFAHAGSLHAHRRTHSAARPHACARCPAAFRLRAGLARHARAHERAAPKPTSYFVLAPL